MKAFTGKTICGALLLSGIAIGLAVPGIVAAQTLPPSIRILVGVAAGGPNDAVARMVAERLRTKKGIQTIVENRTGANGVIAANVLAQAAPDGQTILMSSQGLMTISPHLTKLAFDPLRDFSVIGGIATTETAFCVANRVPANNFRDFVKLAREARPLLSFGTAGQGNVTHLILERIKEVAKIDYLPVHYKGIAPSLQDVAGGHIDASACALVTAIPLIQGGKLKALAMFGDKRSKLLPDVPTTAEQGYPILDVLWYAIIGPAHMPRELTQGLFVAIRDVMSEPEALASLEKVGFSFWPQDPAEMTKIMREESARWGKIIRDNGIKAE